MTTSSENFKSDMKTLLVSKDFRYKCGLCNEQNPKYTCPKCGVFYCSLICFRSFGHSVCSENFFKEFVVNELESQNQQVQSVQAIKEKMKIVLMNDRETCENDLDSDDSVDNQEDLAERMKNVDLNDSIAVWNHLSERERTDFNRKIISGEITELLPKWDPWWVKTEKYLIEDTDIPRSSNVPAIKNAIPALSTIMRKEPNEAVINGLANILYGYACISRLFMQDWTGNANSIIELILTVSEVLSSNLCFRTAHEALDHAHSLAVNLTNVSNQLSLIVKHDVVQILSQQKFILASLSDLSKLLHKGFEANFTPKKRLRISIKKVEFFICFTNEYGVNTLKLH